VPVALLASIMQPDRKQWARAGAIVGVLLALGGSAAAYTRYEASKKPGIQFETKTVEPAHIVARATATGTLSALVTVQVGSQVSGRIKELSADFNSPVKKGDVLARIDPELFDAAVAQAKANHAAASGGLARARAQLKNAKLQLERAEGLAKEQLVSQSELDGAKAAHEAAHADVAAASGQVAQAAASLHHARVNLAYTTIVSPIDGVVISRSVDVGQTVAATLQAPTLFTIAESLHKMQVDTSVAEADVGKLKPGMKATFTVDAWPGERFEGVVRQIRNAPQSVQNVVTYDAVIDVANDALKLKPGMTANVTFVIAEVDAPLSVPNAALRYRPSDEALAAAGSSKEARPRGQRTSAREGDPRRKAVWVLRDGQLERLVVKIGVTDGTTSEVVEGDLRKSDVVVVDASGEKAAAPAASANPLAPGGQRPGRGMGRGI
jgi:HlyD family secretion protein